MSNRRVVRLPGLGHKAPIPLAVRIGDVGDIAHVTVFLKDPALKKYVDEEWVAMFPDPDDRPARHAVAVDREGPMLVQLEIVAVLDGRA